MRRSKNTLLLLLHNEHTSPHSVSLWMVWQVLKLYPLAGTGVTLKFYAGFGPDWHYFAILCATGLYVRGLVPSRGALVWKTVRGH